MFFNGEVIINKGHKYYTQVILQIQLSQSNQGYFKFGLQKIHLSKLWGKMKHFGKKYLLISNFFSKDLLQGCWQSIHLNFVVLVKKCY